MKIISNNNFDNWFAPKYKLFYNFQNKHSLSIAKKEIKILSKLITYWNYQYYVCNKSIINDFQYDAALKLLENWENKFPSLILVSSPTQFLRNMIGDLPKQKHVIEMKSIKNGYSKKEIEHFYNSIFKLIPNNLISKHNFFVEPKIDGISIELIYENGILNSAVTRGSGIEGEIVTHNLWNAKHIPKKINFTKKIVILAEIYILNSDMDVIAKQRNDNKLLVNRNVVSGLVRQKNKFEKNSYLYFCNNFQKNCLRIWCHGIANADKLNIKAQEDLFIFLKKLNFPINLNWNKKISTFHDVEPYYQALWKEIEQKEIDISMDGIVLKINNFSVQRQIGTSEKFYKWSIAYKFPESCAITQLIDYEVTVGKTGRITYVGTIKPTLLDNSIINKVTLNNFFYINKLKLKLNSKIKIKKSGGIIPKIIEVLNNEKNENEKIIPKCEICPSCSNFLIDEIEIQNNKNDKTYLQRCINSFCSAKKLKRLIYFFSNNGLNIIGLGEKLLTNLFENKIIDDPLDFFTLVKNVNFLANRLLKNNKIVGVLNATKIINQIKTIKKNITLIPLLNALNIFLINKGTLKIILKNINNFNACTNLSIENLSVIKGIGEKKAKNFYDFFQKKEYINRILKIFGNVKNSNTNKYNHLNNKFFTITGKLNKYSRRNLIKKIELYGGIYNKVINKSNNYLIMNANNFESSKYKKAMKLKIPIINENKFDELIKKPLIYEELKILVKKNYLNLNKKEFKIIATWLKNFKKSVLKFEGFLLAKETPLLINHASPIEISKYSEFRKQDLISNNYINSSLIFANWRNIMQNSNAILNITNENSNNEIIFNKQNFFTKLSTIFKKIRKFQDYNWIIWNDNIFNLKNKFLYSCAKNNLSYLENKIFDLKLNYLTIGYPSNAGSEILLNYSPSYNSTVYTKLLKAKAILFSKSNMDELGHCGLGVNNYFKNMYHFNNKDYLTGGSSGGGAGLTQSGIVDFSLGTDTGDSVRAPAMLCNIFGFKPTWGRISRYGIIPYAPSLDTVGILAKEIKLILYVYLVLQGKDKNDLTTIYDYNSSQTLENYKKLDLKKIKILVPKTMLTLTKNTNKKYFELFFQFISQLKNEYSLFIQNNHLNNKIFKHLFCIYQIIANCEAISTSANLTGNTFGNTVPDNNWKNSFIQTRSNKLSTWTKLRWITGLWASNNENFTNIYCKALQARFEINKLMEKLFQKYDVIIMPSFVNGAMLEKDAIANYCKYKNNQILVFNTVIGNLAALPSLSIPLGKLENNMPIGFIIYTKHKNDLLCLKIGEKLTQLINK